MQIQAKLTLDSIYEQAHVYNPVVSFDKSSWLGERVICDYRSGGQLCIAGKLTYLCHQSVATDRGLKLLRDSGINVAEHIRTYQSVSDYRKLLCSLNGKLNKAVIQHMHSSMELKPESYWISPKLICHLNNKGNLAEIAPVTHVPGRRIEKPAEITLDTIELPVVLKVVSNQSSVSGNGIRICHSAEQLKAALRLFSNCEYLVIEEYLDIDKSYCVQFVAKSSGDIQYIGMAEQVVTEEGFFNGNWLDDQRNMPNELVPIGYAIIKRAVEMGYRGIAGFDFAVCTNGDKYVLDLNFRSNGSTAPLLLHDSMTAFFDSPVMRYTTWRGILGFEVFEQAIRRAVDERIFLPLCIYDPFTTDKLDEPVVLGIATGQNKTAVVQNMKILASYGLVPVIS